MDGIGPNLPLQKNQTHGLYGLITSYKEEVEQNFKNLILTSPGERMMDPAFGVGLRHFLFEHVDVAVPRIRQRIGEQITKYMPFIRITKLQFNNRLDKKTVQDSLLLSISIQYDVPSMNLSAELNLQAEDIN
jgi:phage baseplate assembly protein W